MHVCMINTVATASLALKHQAICSHDADKIFIASYQSMKTRKVDIINGNDCKIYTSFHQDLVLIPMPSLCWEIIENAYFCVSEINLAWQGLMHFLAMVVMEHGKCTWQNYGCLLVTFSHCSQVLLEHIRFSLDFLWGTIISHHPCGCDI